MHEEDTGQPLESFLRLCLPRSGRPGLWLVPGACCQLGWASCPGSPRDLLVSVSSLLRSWVCTTLPPPFYMRIDLWFFFLNDNHFSSRAISSSPKLTFKHGKVTESEVIWSLKIISFLCCPHLKKKAIYVTSKVRIKLINGKGYWYEIEILKTIFHSFWISITKVVFVEARKKVKMDQEFTTWEKATY